VEVGDNIFNKSDIIGSGRVLTLTDTLTFTGGSGATKFTQTVGGNTITQGVGTNPIGFSLFGDISLLSTSGQFDVYGGYLISGGKPVFQASIYDNTLFTEQASFFSGIGSFSGTDRPYAALYYTNPSGDSIGFEANVFGERIMSQNAGLNIINPIDASAGMAYLSGSGGTGFIGVTNQTGFATWIGTSLSNNYLPLSGGTMSGFTQLGSDAPAIKMKKLTISVATPGGFGAQQVVHGLTAAKIISYTCVMAKSNGSIITPESTNETLSLFTSKLTATTCSISYDGGTNTGIHNSTVTFLIMYEA